MRSWWVESLRKFYMLSGKVLVPYLHSGWNEIRLGHALEASFAVADANLPQDFPSNFGASNFIWWYIFCSSMVDFWFYRFSVTFLPLLAHLQIEKRTLSGRKIDLLTFLKRFYFSYLSIVTSRGKYDVSAPATSSALLFWPYFRTFRPIFISGA